MKKESNDSQGLYSEVWRMQEEGALQKVKDQGLDPDSLQTLRIAAYVRLSPSGNDREEGSLVSHPQRIKDFVSWKNNQAGNGWGKIVKWYTDKDQSGKDLNRPDFQKMCRDIESGLVDAVLVTELSRLSRKVKDFYHLWDFLKEHNVKFISLKENFDTSTPMGELMLIQAIGFAQFERETIVERIKNGSRARAERGLANGNLPLGFDLVFGKANYRQVNEEEKAYVQMIFKKMLELNKMANLLKFLNDNGYKTKEYTTKAGIKKGGKRWALTTLHQLLTNRAYIGQREFNKKNRTKDQSTLAKNDRYFFTKAQWPGIVDEPLFFDVQRLLEHNKKKARKYIYTYKLTGLIKCSECGASLCGKSATGKNSKFFYYGHVRKMKTQGDEHLKRCHIENIPAPQLEELVLERLKTLAKDKSLLARLVGEFHSEENEDYRILKTLIHSKENKRRALLNKMDNLVDAIGDTTDKATRRVLQEKIPVLEKERKRLTDEIKTHRNELTGQKENVVDVEKAFAFLRAFNKGLLDESASVQAQLLQDVIKEIVVLEDRVVLKIYGAKGATITPPHPPSTGGKTSVECSNRIRIGTVGWIRTSDRSLRRRMLYPAELRPLKFKKNKML